MIFAPENPTDAAEWAAVFAGHYAVGVVAAVICAWLIGVPDAVIAAPVLYLIVWEGIVQRFGAGIKDALLDAYAVALGSATIWAAWQHNGPVLALSVVLAAVSVAVGIGRRL